MHGARLFHSHHNAALSSHNNFARADYGDLATKLVAAIARCYYVIKCRGEVPVADSRRIREGESLEIEATAAGLPLTWGFSLCACGKHSN